MEREIEQVKYSIINVEKNLIGTSQNLQSNQMGLQKQILNLEQPKFANLSIYYNYYNKTEFKKQNMLTIFVDTVDSIEHNAEFKGKLYYNTHTYDSNNIFSEMVLNSNEGNINATYIGPLDDPNYGTKHAKFYHIVSSTGIYKNYKYMSLIKHEGDHNPREWILS